MLNAVGTLQFDGIAENVASFPEILGLASMPSCCDIYSEPPSRRLARYGAVCGALREPTSVIR